MKLKFTYFLLGMLFIAFLTDSCTDDDTDTVPDTEVEDTLAAFLKFIPPSEQRMDGDPQAGYDYLVYGNYVGLGVPYDAYQLAFGGQVKNLLNRTGDNANVDYAFTATNAPNGVKITAPNCLQCHAQTLNGELVVGLGNAVGDFTTNESDLIPIVDIAIENMFGKDSPEWEAYEPFRRSALTVGPHIKTQVRGVNPADQLMMALAAHRDKKDLIWQEEDEELEFPILDYVMPTDVPAWWLLKKKNAMFFSGAGRKDFAKISTASGLLTLADSTEAREIDKHFPDVIAYIRSIEPPKYTREVDQSLADEGKIVFENNCQGCHGSYGANEFYPNFLVDIDHIQTDPMFIDTYRDNPEFFNWYNSSWYGTSSNPGQFVTEDGYVAPPLDGIWATAPYLHNGSVPTLETLLNSEARPTYWSRSFGTDDVDYDHEEVGWKYTEEATGEGTQIYDTTLPGYRNIGHTFGDDLTAQERGAVIEYLKTL